MTMDTNDQMERTVTAVMAELKESRDAVSVRRVFGEPYECDGVTVIPVARVGGGGGGGGGGGEGPEDGPSAGSGSGFGSGFGINARPVGVYEVRDGKVTWKPAVDAGRLARGGQVLAGIIAVCVTLVLLQRGR